MSNKKNHNDKRVETAQSSINDIRKSLQKIQMILNKEERKVQSGNIHWGDVGSLVRWENMAKDLEKEMVSANLSLDE